MYMYPSMTHSLPNYSPLSSSLPSPPLSPPPPSLCLSRYWILDCAELPLYSVNGDVPVREEEEGTLRVSSYHFRVLVYKPLVIHGIDGIHRRGLGPNIESLGGQGERDVERKR